MKPFLTQVPSIRRCTRCPEATAYVTWPTNERIGPYQWAYCPLCRYEIRRHLRVTGDRVGASRLLTPVRYQEAAMNAGVDADWPVR